MTARFLSLAAGLLAALALAGCGGKSETNPPAPSTPTMIPSPDTAMRVRASVLLDTTKLPDLKDMTKSLADYRGPAGIVVVFADTTCPFAGAALGDLPKVASKLADYKIAAIVVNIGNEKSDVLAAYARRNTGTPVVYDDTDATKNAWTVTTVPTVVFINGNGQTAYRGEALWKNLAGAVEKATGSKPGSVDFGVAGTAGG